MKKKVIQSGIPVKNKTLEEIFAEIDAERKKFPIRTFFQMFGYRIKDFYSSIKWFIFRDVPHRIKFGCSEKDIWSLDYTAAKWLLKRLKAIRVWYKKHPCCPSNFEENKSDSIRMQLWIREIDKMIYAFSVIVKIQDLDCESNEFKEIDVDTNKVAKKCYEDGIKSFNKYFRNLWT